MSADDPNTSTPLVSALAAAAEARELSRIVLEEAARRAELDRMHAVLDGQHGFSDLLLDNWPGGLVMVSPTGAILRANSVAIRFLGMPQDILSRREVSDWGTTTLREDGTVCPVEDYPVIRCMLSGEPQPATTIGVRHPSGAVVWGVFYATPAHSAQGELLGVVVSFLDVTERRRVEEELRRSETRMRTLFEHSPDHIVVVDQDTRLLYLNRAAPGFELADVLGRSCYEFIAPETQERMREAIEAAKAGESSHYEAYSDELGRHYVTRVAPLGVDSEGRWTAMLISTDVSEQRRIEASQRSLEARMRQVERMESLSILAGGVAHDFNNLLMGILGRTELALRGLESDHAVREHLEAARMAALRARDLTDELLAYSGGGTLVVEPCDLNSVVGETVRLLELNQLAQHRIAFDLDEALPAVEGDATQLRQVVMNLLTNAAEASPPGTTIHIRTREVPPSSLPDDAPSAGLRQAARVAQLEVKDEGEGMPAETLARIFDPFFSTKFTGRGLGLATVQGVVRGHEGLLSVDSTPGEGTTFRVLLPGSTRLTGATEPPALRPSEPPSGVVLVVDDEEHVRAVSRAILEVSGYTVLTASDGREALARFGERRDIDAVVLDLIMPNLNGEETLAELRTLRPGLPVVLTSGYGEELALRRLPLGPSERFLRKPYGLDDLVRVVQELTSGEPAGDP